MLACLRAIGDDDEVVVVRVKNKMHLDHKSATSAGYRSHPESQESTNCGLDQGVNVSSMDCLALADGVPQRPLAQLADSVGGGEPARSGGTRVRGAAPARELRPAQEQRGTQALRPLPQLPRGMKSPLLHPDTNTPSRQSSCCAVYLPPVESQVPENTEHQPAKHNYACRSLVT